VNFSNPIWLWALLALVVPLLIHLINLGKPKAIPFGSLLWLPQKNTKLSRQIKFQKKWLWLIRSLLFMLIAALIAYPYYSQTIQQKNKHILLIQDGVQEKIIQQIEDTISLNQWNVKRLSYGLENFNFKETNIPFDKAINPFSILQLLENETYKPLSVKIVGNFNSTDLHGKIPDYSFPVNWILLPSNYSDEYIVQIQREESSSYLVTDETMHLTKIIEEQNIADIDSNNLVLNLKNKTGLIVYDKKLKSLKESTFAALMALQAYHNLSFNIKESKADDLPADFDNIDLLFWLSELTPPKLNIATKIFYVSVDLPNGTFFQYKPNVLEWSEPIHYNKLPYLLNDMIFYNEFLNKRLEQVDNRPIHASFYADERVSYVPSPLEYQNKKYQSLVIYCWLLIMVLLLIERYLNSQ